MKPTFGTVVRSVRRAGQGWRIEAGERSVEAPIVVVATGWLISPNVRHRRHGVVRRPILHSSAYRDARHLPANAFVVGFGNSARRSRLISVKRAQNQRSPCVHRSRVAARSIRPANLSFSLAQRFLPARVADTINAPIIRLAVGALEPLGLKVAAKGPTRMVKEDGRVPVLDIGALAQLREGKIAVRGGVTRFALRSVAFEDGRSEPSTRSYSRPASSPTFVLCCRCEGGVDPNGRPLVSDQPTAEPGLFFVGAIASPTGQLRQIRIGAKRVAGKTLRFPRDKHG